MRMDISVDESQNDLDNSIAAGSLANNSFLPNGQMLNIPITPGAHHGLAALNTRFTEQDDEKSYVDAGDAQEAEYSEMIPNSMERQSILQPEAHNGYD